MAHGKAWMVRNKRCWPACESCYVAYRRAIKRQVYMRDTGQSETPIDSGKSEKLAREMIEVYGRQLRWVAAQSGLSEPAIKRILDGKRHTVYPRTQKKLEKLHARVLAEGKWDRGLKGDWRPAELSVLAVKGLMAQGWSQPWIAEQVGSAQRPISALICGRQKYVSAQREQALLDVVRKVGSSTGPSVKSISKAKKMGWQPTIWYDELV